MSKEFLNKLAEMGESKEPFVLATVIDTEGSSSAKPGSKAIFDKNGKRVTGWVGGGCAESETSHESINAILDGKPRIIDIDLDDEVLGAGMPCGGSMRVYVEPYLVKSELLIIGHGRITEVLSELGSLLNFTVTINDPIANKESFPNADNIINKNYEDLDIGRQTYVIVATQHKGDHFSLKEALKSESPYVALIASKKRTQITFQYLLDTGVPEESIKRVRAPAGLDLGGSTPELVALSIISEIVSIENGGTAKPLMEVKGTKLQSPVSTKSD
ncbi:MAG: putative xanthine dehydrogenase subunit A [Candidatus Heimdallarchaeota archaeon LC_2]|nr:MAG: putative xanthine dehydrogenase subunit A [Candidatus Heimdallarchaeota archaeon LC_2]